MLSLESLAWVTLTPVLLLLATACSGDKNDSEPAQEANPYQVEGSANANELPPQVMDIVARHSNDVVLSWCREGADYEKERCKQHLRGRMARFGCELNLGYEELRGRWISSYQQSGRYSMMPDDAFYAFLEDEDFCDPKQPDDSTNTMNLYMDETPWNDR